MVRGFLSALVLVMAAVVAGCGALPRGPAVPEAEQARANPLGIPNARFYADGDPAAIVAEAKLALERRQAARREQGKAALLEPTADFLALSGGGDNGAFGAGFVVGWTAAGTRPEFALVTGISTGALIAPFAFLGPQYDDQLRMVYTTLGRDRVFFRRRLTAALFNDALADSSPLADTIAYYANDTMLAAIAEEYRRGRLLLVGTTDLDAQRPVIWNIGAIAASGHPGALDLFRRILQASAAIPGAFPPAMIDIEIDGRKYQEMHVDGATMAQLFLYPGSFDPGTLKSRSRQTAYVIRNGRLDPEHAETSRRAISIASRAMGTLLQSAGYSDVVQAYFLTKRDGVAYRLAYIGPEFRTDRSGPFDLAYMRALFDYGYDQARSAHPWHDAPPGLHTTRPADESGGRQAAAARTR